jgi:hypothetical protein
MQAGKDNHTRPTRTGRGHASSNRNGELGKYRARRDPMSAALDQATYTRDVWVICKILRMHVLEKCSLRRINWDWEWKWWKTRGERRNRF